jgi:hypothetical protein
MHMLVLLCNFCLKVYSFTTVLLYIVPACCHVEFNIVAMESKTEMSKNGKLINLKELTWVGFAQV